MAATPRHFVAMRIDDKDVKVSQSDDGRFQTRAAEMLGGPFGGLLIQTGVRAVIDKAARSNAGLTLQQLKAVVNNNHGECAWTDSGQANEDRQLKHRGVRDTRPVPASPELVVILRQHIESFPTSPDGRLFVTRVGRAGVPLPPPFAKPLSMGTTYRVWAAARAATHRD